MLSLRNRWLFVHVPRTGGNSLQQVLLEYSDDAMVTDELRDGIDRFEITGPHTKYKHVSMQHYFESLPRLTFGALTKFAVVRNPFQRAISQYFAPIKWIGEAEKPVFRADRFLKTLGETEEMVDLLSVEGRLATNLVLRYERLSKEAAELLSLLGIREQIPHVNRGFAGPDWRQYYRQYPDLVAVVARRFERDIKAFDYAFDLPTQDDVPTRILR